MKPANEGGSRLAIVFSGSPLFSGAAGSGESEIRRWIIENDWLEAIVGLPDQLFYNTGISTYFWVVTNRKAPERRGKVVLLDARDQWAKMRKSLGDKRKYVTDDQIVEITRLYHDALELAGTDDRVKVFDNSDFGYQRITVERPLRRRWIVTEGIVEQVAASRQFRPLAAHVDPKSDGQRLLAAVRDLVGVTEDTELALATRLVQACAAHTVILTTPLRKAVLDAAAVADSDAPVINDRKHNPLPDPDLRDNENVPLAESIDTYVAREVLPHVPDAWVDDTKSKIGYEIPFSRHFYQYVPPRPLAEIDAEILAVETEIELLLRLVTR
jgi:type I restriction enzyme M protein